MQYISIQLYTSDRGAMAGKKESTESWRQTTVLIRSDIFEQAKKAGIDISAECNSALAAKTGVDFHRKRVPDEKNTVPVIVADNPPGSVHAVSKRPATHPAEIINADDPGAPKTVRSRRAQPKPAPVAPTGQTSSGQMAKPEHEKTVPHAPEKNIPPKGEAAGRKKGTAAKKKDDMLKKFFGAVVHRNDDTGSIIAKDDMYAAFVRWCRDNQLTQVPDKRAFSVSLKNRFAVPDTSTNGTGFWVGVQLKK